LYSNLRFVISASLVGCAGLIGVLALLPPTLEERLLASAELSAPPAPACNQQNWLRFDRNCLSRRGMPWVANLPAPNAIPSPVESAPEQASDTQASAAVPAATETSGAASASASTEASASASTDASTQFPPSQPSMSAAQESAQATDVTGSRQEAPMRSTAARDLSPAGRRRTACGQATQRHAARSATAGRHRTARCKACRRVAATRREENNSRSSSGETEQ
jgi:hypothetical protein